MESYPEQCKTPDGKTYTRQISTQSDWQLQTVDEIGLTFKMPPTTTFRKEIADDYGRIRNLGFYVEKGPSDKPTYMLYGLYRFQTEATEQDLEKAKTEMDKTTIKEASIDGYKGIEGLILGPKTATSQLYLKTVSSFLFQQFHLFKRIKYLQTKFLPLLTSSKKLKMLAQHLFILLGVCYSV